LPAAFAHARGLRPALARRRRSLGVGARSFAGVAIGFETAWHRGLDIILVITKIIVVLTETSVLTAIASPRRREILRLVWDREVSAGEISRAMPDVTFGAVSLQLRALLEAGLVETRAERQRTSIARGGSFGPVAACSRDVGRRALEAEAGGGARADPAQSTPGPGHARSSSKVAPAAGRGA
jgi:DNA-binding transcriptional ArsR family regulator